MLMQQYMNLGMIYLIKNVYKIYIKVRNICMCIFLHISAKLYCVCVFCVNYCYLDYYLPSLVHVCIRGRAVNYVLKY